MIRLLICLLMLITIFMPAYADKRVALVIGNSAYHNTTRLNNPTKDSRDVAAALRRLQFEVTEYHDVDFSGMRSAMKRFGRAARKADMAILYFAGHGMEVGGENWLIPVDADLLSDDEMEDEAIGLSYVMGKLRGADKLGLVILDACRNDPFSSKMTRTSGITRSVNRGFARVEPEGNILVAYAAREGTLAQDGNIGENSPYATALLQHIETPNLDIQFLFRRIRDAVKTASRGIQVPHTYGSLPGKQIFLKTKKVEPDHTAEIAFWNSIKESNEQPIYEAYLSTYKNGIFSKLALAKIDLILQKQVKMRRALEATLEVERKAQAKRLAKQVARLAEEKRATLAAINKAELADERKKLRKVREAELVTERAKLTAERDLFAKRKVALEEAQNQRAALEKRLATLESAKKRKSLQKDASSGNQIKIARLDQSGSETNIKPSTEPVDVKELARQVQKELNRIGCSAGRPDGIWGKGSRRALKQYGRYAKIKLASLQPSSSLLDQLKTKVSRICPLICGAGFEQKNGKCVRAKREASIQKLEPEKKTTTIDKVSKKTNPQKRKRASRGNKICFDCRGVSELSHITNNSNICIPATHAQRAVLNQVCRRK